MINRAAGETIANRLGGRVRNAPAAYALAIAALVAAVLLRYLLDPWMGDSLPLVTLFGAVAAAVWIGGYRPAIIVAHPRIPRLQLSVHRSLVASSASTIRRRSDRPAGVSLHLFAHHRVRRGGAPRADAAPASSAKLLRITLRSIGDAVITTDVEGRITYMNAVAESLTGWTQPDALGHPLDAVFRIVNEDTRQPVENPATQGAARGRRRRPGESHGADSQRRQRVPD